MHTERSVCVCECDIGVLFMRTLARHIELFDRQAISERHALCHCYSFFFLIRVQYDANVCCPAELHQLFFNQSAINLLRMFV